MAYNDLEFHIDETALENIELNCIDALWRTAEALHTDLVQSQTMRRDTGHMQNNATYVWKNSDTSYDLVTNTPYARRVYYNPEGTNVSKEANPNAVDHWMDTYIKGDNKDFVLIAFSHFSKGR